MRRLALLILAGLLMPGRGVGAQEGPPEPLPLRDVDFPTFHETSLANGLRLVVVPWHEVPFVTVAVVVPGGSAADPRGREGVATFVAQLLTRGTDRRGHEDLSRALDRRGISLAAEVSEAWTTVSLNATTPVLAEGMAILAEVLLHPSFAADRLEVTRTQALTGLQVQSTRPEAVADRAFLRALYGEHPYGRLPTPASVRALTRDDLVAYHDAWYRPDEALVVVSGDLAPGEAEALVADALGGWTPGTPPPPAMPRAPDRSTPEIRVVHIPGSVQAEIRVGHLLPGPGTEGWDALEVANQVLGGGPRGRLQQVLREARGYTYDARSTVTPLPQLGVFRVATAVRTEVAGAAVQEIFDQVERLRTRALPEGELRDTRSHLVGSFPLEVETPQQVAGRVAVHRLLGLPPGALADTRSRVAGVDTAEARSAAERWIRPEQFLVVVAGDAAALQPGLRGFGPVRIEDAEGRPLTLTDLAARPSDEVFDLSGLEPATLEYEIVVGGVPRGRAVRTLEATPGGWRFASVIEAGPQRLEQEVVVDDGLALVSTRSAMAAAGGGTRLEARRVGDRLEGEVADAAGVRPVSIDVPRGVTLSDGLELALWASDLYVGREFRLPVANVQTGRVDDVRLTVEERTEITVPAGTFDVFRVTVTGVDPQTFYVRVEAPHIPVRMESASRPVALELTTPGG